MNDFETINNLIEQTVRSSSYITVAISSTVFILYTLIIKTIDYFKIKNRNKLLVDMAEAIKENTANVVRLNNVLDKTFKEAERKEISKCRMTIENAFVAFKSNIAQDCMNIIIHNNIDQNKQLIVDNISKLVSTEYYNLYSTFSAYEINDVNVATRLKEEWIKEITNSIISIIYDGQEAIDRIAQLNNRLLIAVGTYITYMNNKVFNN